MTITYNGKQYSHQQIWALVEELTSNGVDTSFSCLDGYWWVSVSSSDRCGLSQVPERTAFRALGQAIQDMEERKGGA